ncbi:hypothetical protein EDC96DRAFT_597429 [Choanephora cucurbitarum]|nr:hypothetical protein EDC96DRAFT_597429 [Choanephora cucurbitarum]
MMYEKDDFMFDKHFKAHKRPREVLLKSPESVLSSAIKKQNYKIFGSKNFSAFQIDRLEGASRKALTRAILQSSSIAQVLLKLQQTIMAFLCVSILLIAIYAAILESGQKYCRVSLEKLAVDNRFWGAHREFWSRRSNNHLGCTYPTLFYRRFKLTKI